jgi:hypothetical protein
MDKIIQIAGMGLLLVAGVVITCATREGVGYYMARRAKAAAAHAKVLQDTADKDKEEKQEYEAWHLAQQRAEADGRDLTKIL